MFAKIKYAKSFSECLGYCLSDKKELSDEQKTTRSLSDGLQHKNRAEIFLYHYCYGDKAELAMQFRDVSKLNQVAQNLVVHLVFRLAPEDQLSRRQWIEICQMAVKEFKIDKNQYVCIMHHDTKQKHIHIVGNRVGYDGKLARHDFSYYMMNQLRIRMEQDFNLVKTLPPRRYLSKEERLIPRTGDRRVNLKMLIQKILQVAKDFLDFVQRMTAHGYQVSKNKGIAFGQGRIWVKGSEVDYPLKTIEKQLALNAAKLVQDKQKVSPDSDLQPKISRGPRMRF